MRIIEIEKLPNGAHRNQNGDFSFAPAGWAVIPPGLATPNFPFGDITVADGVVTAWDPLPMPEPKPVVEQLSEIERIEALEADNKKLTAQLRAANEANAFLEECIVEMAGIVYA